MIVDADGSVIATIGPGSWGRGPSSIVRFDPQSGEQQVRWAPEGTRDPVRHGNLILWPVDTGPGLALFARQVTDLDTDVARVEVDSRDRLRTQGDVSLEDFPERVPLIRRGLSDGEGRVLDFGVGALRRFDLHELDSLVDFDSGYELYEWTVTMEARYAVVSTQRGGRRWPVLDLESGQVSHVLEGVGYNRPVLAISDDGMTMAVGIHDQIHRLPSLLGPVGGGVRLKSDNSGSYIEEARFDSSGGLVITWIRRQTGGLIEESDTAESLLQKIADAQRTMDVREFVEGTIATESGSSVLIMDLSSPAITHEASFSERIRDAVRSGDWAVARTRDAIHHARLAPIDWVLFPPREPGERLWF